MTTESKSLTCFNPLRSHCFTSQSSGTRPQKEKWKESWKRDCEKINSPTQQWNPLWSFNGLKLVCFSKGLRHHNEGKRTFLIQYCPKVWIFRNLIHINQTGSYSTPRWGRLPFSLSHIFLAWRLLSEKALFCFSCQRYSNSRIVRKREIWMHPRQPSLPLQFEDNVKHQKAVVSQIDTRLWFTNICPIHSSSFYRTIISAFASSR